MQFEDNPTVRNRDGLRSNLSELRFSGKGFGRTQDALHLRPDRVPAPYVQPNQAALLSFLSLIRCAGDYPARKGGI